MLLKLIPATQEPTIHFSLSFADPPSSLPTPPSWTAQLSHLMHEDLEVPATLHSLDRAAGVSSLLEEVALDINAKEIRCLFVDGSVERIPFGFGGERYHKKLMDAVGCIISNVRESTMEDERVARQREAERQRARSASITAAPAYSVKFGKLGKHKKQRSLFMHIVSSIGSIINLSSPSSPSYPTLPFHSRSGYRSSTSVIPSPDATSLTSPTLPNPGSSPRARALRRAARSALVDTYRRFVLGELVRRFYLGPDAVSNLPEGEEYTPMYGLENHHQRERGGFCVWILHSMRRRALIRMEQLLAEAGPPPPDPVRFSEDSANGLCPTTMDVPLSFSDEEDEEPESPISMDCTDVRASSYTEFEAMDVDTPSQSVENRGQDHPPRPSMFPRRASSSASNDSSESGSTTRSSSSMSYASTAPSSIESEPDLKEDTAAKELPIILHRPRHFSQQPNISHLAPVARHEYTQLSTLRTRLGHLVQFAASQTRVAADEVRSRLDMLAVRSRRRAWLNKALKGPLVMSGSTNAGGSMFGLATPFRSSPLARYVLTADDLARRRSMISRSPCSSTSSLSSAYFRSVSSTSSSSSLGPSPTSSLSKASITPFPSSRPRLRPKLDYAVALAAAVVEYADSPAQTHVDADKSAITADDGNLVVTTMEDINDDDDERLVDQEFEIYQEIHGPARTRRHRRSMQDTILPVAPLATSRVPGARLLPVSEERENENDEFTLALSARGGKRPRRQGAFASAGEHTFMGCDEVHIADEEDEEYLDRAADFEYDGGAQDNGTPDLEMGLGADVEMTSIAEDPTNAQRPRVRPRVRRSSMVDALLRGAKGVQRSLSGGSKQQQQAPSAPLAADSLLYQPVAGARPHTAPKTQPLPSTAHAPNRRALDLARPPVATVYANVDVEMGGTEMNVQLRIDDFDYTAGIPLPNVKGVAGASAQFEAELQQYHAQEQEFTLAMDVPRGGGGGGRRWRNGQYPGPHDAARRPKLSNIFDEGQVS